MISAPATLRRSDEGSIASDAGQHSGRQPQIKVAPVIHVCGLTRVFRTFKKEPGFAGALRGLFYRKHHETIAARDVSFDLVEGEMVGFLDPHGAGKTTT